MDSHLLWAFWPECHFPQAELVDPGLYPFLDATPSPNRRPCGVNRSLSKLLFGRLLDALRQQCLAFHTEIKRRLSLITHPFGDGVDHTSLLPMTLAEPVLRLEQPQASLSRHLDFRVMIGLEKCGE